VSGIFSFNSHNKKEERDGFVLLIGRLHLTIKQKQIINYYIHTLNIYRGIWLLFTFRNETSITQHTEYRPNEKSLSKKG